MPLQGDSHTVEQLRQAIIDGAVEGIDSVTIDGLSVRAKNLRELIEAEQHLQTETAGKRGHRGLRFTKLIPPGAH